MKTTRLDLLVVAIEKESVAKEAAKTSERIRKEEVREEEER